MSEGQLKNKIIAQTTFRHTSHGNEEVFNLEAVKQILDEAKKDFPFDEGHYSDLLFTDRATILCEQRLIWFKKWFGE